MHRGWTWLVVISASCAASPPAPVDSPATRVARLTPLRVSLGPAAFQVGDGNELVGATVATFARSTAACRLAIS